MYVYMYVCLCVHMYVYYTNVCLCVHVYVRTYILGLGLAVIYKLIINT